MPDDVVPETPREAGVADATPDIVEVEPLHLLANDARERLNADGFDDDEIDEWAAAYVAERGQSVTVDEFVAWIAEREHRE